VKPHEPDGAAVDVRNALARVARRLWLRETLRALTLAFTIASLGLVVFAVFGGVRFRAAMFAFALGLSGGALLWIRRRTLSTPAAAARTLERSRPESRNLIVTAEELFRLPERARPHVQARVFGRAAEIVHALDAAAVVPLKRDILMAAAAVVLGVTALAWLPQRTASVFRGAGQQTGAVAEPRKGELTLAATITPPDYTGQPVRTVANPDRIDALKGSRLRLGFEPAGSWRVRFGTNAVKTSQTGNDLIAEMTLTESGYLAIEPADAKSTAGRLLIPVAVSPDHSPTIRVDAPGKDLLLPDATSKVAVSASATDDLGLRALELHYTKVSGSGEQFAFTEGSLPVAIARESGRSWSARADIEPGRLAVAPGDSLIYRFVGRDHRPGDAGLASSDTFFIEIAGPGQATLAGFELPPERERYAFSQQMIVLKLERLRARERSLARAALENAAASIAAEQRAVRANFVFLTGGQVEDEEVEAEHSHEIQEGRLEHSARREIVSAIQHMTRVEQELAAISTAAALPPARAAVEALQRAFARNRYLLRTVPVRSRIDPARRLTGELGSAANWRREVVAAREMRPAATARLLFGRVLELSPKIQAGTIPSAALEAIAEDAIAVDPASAEWQAISKQLLQLRDSSGPGEERAKLLNRTGAALATAARKDAPIAHPPSGAAGRLRAAWAEEQRRR
jgi:hypothetical protein